MAVCKICGEDYYKLGLHIKSHGLSMMDYWVQYESETHEYPKCKYCGKPITHFINGSMSCGPSIYCNCECMNADLPNVLKERHKQGVYEGTSYLTEKWNYDVDSRMDSLARTVRARMLQETDPLDEGYFYIVILNGDSVKIGATRQEIYGYIKNRYNQYDPKIHRIYTSTILNVANIEYYIKTSNRFKKYIDEGYLSRTEEFEIGAKDIITEFTDKVPFLHRI